MAGKFIPGLHPIAKAARGWPTARNEKPKNIYAAKKTEKFSKIKIFNCGSGSFEISTGKPGVGYTADPPLTDVGYGLSGYLKLAYADNTVWNCDESIGTGDFAVFWRGSSNSTTDQQSCFSNGGGSNQWRLQFGYNGSSNSTNAASFRTYSGAFTDVGANSLVTIGKVCTWLGVRRGTTLELWRDGELVASNTGTVRNVDSGKSKVGLGWNSSANWTSAPLGGQATHYICGVINGTVSQAEASKISADIYNAVLKPANQTPFLVGVADAGGGTEISVTTGSISVSGTNASISQARNVVVTTGAVSVAATNAVIAQANAIPVTTGSISVAAVNAAISKQIAISATTGALTVAGVNASISQAGDISVTTGAVTVAATNAVIDQQIVGSTNIVVTTGAVSVSGTAAVINQVTNLGITTGAINVAGINASIASQNAIATTTGAIAIAATNATIIAPQIIITQTGAINISGVSATITNKLTGWSTIPPVSSSWTNVADATSIWTEI